MPLYRRPGSPHWWVRIGRKTRRSTGTSDRRQAKQFEEALQERLWRRHKLGDRAAVSFREVAARWLTETQKRTKAKDELILAWFAPYIDEEPLSAITRDTVDQLRLYALEDGKSKATVDRYMALLRAILRKCAHEWRYIDQPPVIPMYRPATPEPRWLTQEQFAALCKELPKHQALAACFAVLTLLRMRSMLQLTWDRIDLKRRRLWVPGSQMKGRSAIGLPLSRRACAVLVLLRRLNPDGEHVFQWKGRPIDDCNTAAFQKGVKRAGLTPFCWHDLRHTGASWAVQNGVTLQELMQLGGWKSYAMVLRYAHLAPDHLATAVEKVGSNVAQRRKQGERKSA